MNSEVPLFSYSLVTVMIWFASHFCSAGFFEGVVGGTERRLSQGGALETKL